MIIMALLVLFAIFILCCIFKVIFKIGFWLIGLGLVVAVIGLAAMGLLIII